MFFLNLKGKRVKVTVSKDKVIPVVGSVVAIIGACVAGLTFDILRELCAVLVLKYATNLANHSKELIAAHRAAKSQ